jgi:hypothetical protein
MALAVGAAYMVTVDVVYFAGLLFQYADPGSGARSELRTKIVSTTGRGNGPDEPPSDR